MKAITKGNFVFRALTMRDKAMAIQMVQDHFLPHSPLLQIFQVKSSEVDHLYKKRVESMLKGQACAGCFHSGSGEPACLALCSVYKRGTKAHEVHLRNATPALTSMVRFWDLLEGDLFASLGAEKLFFKDVGVVNPKFMKFGLFTYLDIYTNRLAEELDCDYVVAEVLSRYSQNVAVKHGYKIMREIRYSDYVDPVTGCKPNLKLSSVHEKAQIAYGKVPFSFPSLL